MKPRHMAIVGFVLVCRGTSFVDELKKVLNYRQTFVRDYGMLFQRTKRVEIVRDRMWSYFSEKLAPPHMGKTCELEKSRWDTVVYYMSRGNWLRHYFQSGFGSEWNGRHDIHGFWRENRTNFVFFAKEFIRLRTMCYTPSFTIVLLFCYSMRYKSCTTAIEESWCGPGTNSLWLEFLSRSGQHFPSVPCFSKLWVYSSMTLVIDVRCTRCEKNRKTTTLRPLSPSISAVVIQWRRVTSR